MPDLMNIPNYLSMVATDLDGTLRDSSRGVSNNDFDVLRILGERGICRIIATGRNLFSARRVLPMDMPIDYLVFSLGAGILNWKTQEIIYTSSITSHKIEHILLTLRSESLDFMIHHPIPQNHHFEAYSTENPHPDFISRCCIYQEFAQVRDYQSSFSGDACQVIAISDDIEGCFDRVSEKLAGLSVIRTTSPLDGKSLWIEIFPKNVSKGQTVRWLAEKHNIMLSRILCLGNDYNDFDLLQIGAYSFVMPSAPGLLLQHFSVIDDERSPLTSALNMISDYAEDIKGI